MRRLSRTHAGPFRRATRGVAFMWTILIAMPLMFFGLSMAVDFTRVILAGREMRTATHAAALAGAYQFQPGRAELDRAAARFAARETMCVSQQFGVKNAVAASAGGSPCGPGFSSVSMTMTFPTASTMQVTTRYRVDGLLLLKYFDGEDSEYSVTRTAAVCDPRDSSGPTAGYCVRPPD